MALPLGKLALIVGAGVAASVLAKEGRVSDFISGAIKIVAKGIKQDESTSSVKKPRNDFLIAQVDSLRQELEKMASSRPVTIVTTAGSSANRYGAVVIVIVVGSGYIWWKGWKLPDFMFATRGNLAAATAIIAKPLENLFSSIPVMKRHLSSRMALLDNSLDEVAEITASTKESINDITAEVDSINANVAFIRDAVENLETKICRIEGKQDITNHGVLKLAVEASRSQEQIQASSSNSRASLEPPPVTPSSWIASLPRRGLFLEYPSSPDSNGSHQETNCNPVMMDSPKSPQSVNGEGSNSNTSSSSGLGFLGRMGSGITGSLFTKKAVNRSVATRARPSR